MSHATTTRLATVLAVATSGLAILAIITIATSETIGHYTYYEGLKSGGLCKEDVSA